MNKEQARKVLNKSLKKDIKQDLERLSKFKENIDSMNPSILLKNIKGLEEKLLVLDEFSEDLKPEEFDNTVFTRYNDSRVLRGHLIFALKKALEGREITAKELAKELKESEYKTPQKLESHKTYFYTVFRFAKEQGWMKKVSRGTYIKTDNTQEGLNIVHTYNNFDDAECDDQLEKMKNQYIEDRRNAGSR